LLGTACWIEPTTSTRNLTRHFYGLRRTPWVHGHEPAPNAAVQHRTGHSGEASRDTPQRGEDTDGWRPAAEAIARFYRTFDAWFGNKTTPVNGFLEPSPESKFEGRPEFELESLHRTAMIGTPVELIERLRSYQELGVDEISLWRDNSLPHAEKRKSLELFIKEVVVPALT
jgi:alkanesulfonate monooxygenase SsuD/methylene tetrahydromethanopterin reductase-like flavin-dependent oxidoreductase (luciferase family)